MKKFYLLVFLVFLTAFSYAQTAEKVEALLDNVAVTYGEAASLILEAGDVLTGASQAEAFQKAVNEKWLSGNVSANDTAKLDKVSLLVMRSFDFKGGIFYSLFKSPHYAYRELVYQYLVEGRTDPQMDVSGDLLLFIVGRALSRVEAGQL